MGLWSLDHLVVVRQLPYSRHYLLKFVAFLTASHPHWQFELPHAIVPFAPATPTNSACFPLVPPSHCPRSLSTMDLCHLLLNLDLYSACFPPLAQHVISPIYIEMAIAAKNNNGDMVWYLIYPHHPSFVLVSCLGPAVRIWVMVIGDEQQIKILQDHKHQIKIVRTNNSTLTIILQSQVDQRCTQNQHQCNLCQVNRVECKYEDLEKEIKTTTSDTRFYPMGR